MTHCVVLRDVGAGDLRIFFEHQLDPDALRMAAFRARDRDAFTAHWTKLLADETVIKKTILVDRQVAGNVVSFEQSGGEPATRIGVPGGPAVTLLMTSPHP
jgi:hypothetical protein